jgi:prolyl oligopeptidase
MTAVQYPPARHGGVVDDYHGHLVADPYRWLEDSDSAETRQWIRAENAVTERFLAASGSREQIRARLATLWDYARLDVPFERGGRWFQTRNTGLQDQPVLYVAGGPDEEGLPLLDPNQLSPDGTVAVTSLAVGEQGTLLAYATSAGGSDWRTWHLRDVASGYDHPDVVDWSKFSAAAWRRDGSGFYYGAMPAPQPGRELEAENRCPQIRFHRVGTPQADDEMVFFAPDQPEWLPEAVVSDDDRYLIITIRRGTNPENQVLVLDLEDPDAGYQTLVGGFDVKAVVVANVGSRFVLLTNDAADRGRMVSIELEAPDRGRWAEILPQQTDTLVEAHLCGGKLVCHYLRDAHSVLRVHELDGRHVRDVPLPGLVSVAGSRHDVNGIEGRPERDLVHFRVTSFTESGALWSHDVRTGETRLLRASSAGINPDDYVTEQVFAASDDGTRVPMLRSEPGRRGRHGRR